MVGSVGPESGGDCGGWVGVGAAMLRLLLLLLRRLATAGETIGRKGYGIVKKVSEGMRA
jgi:hypothetical protein